MPKYLTTVKESRIADIILLLASMWLVYVSQVFLPYDLSSFGIIPRTVTGLLHIPAAPWVHHSLTHILFNSIPFFVLGYLVRMNGRTEFWEITILIIILGGLGTWLIGFSGLHGGASGLIMGYWSYILTNAYFTRSIKSIVLAMVTLFFYGGLFLILLDVRPNISWAGHASGFLAGALTAWIKYKTSRK